MHDKQDGGFSGELHAQSRCVPMAQDDGSCRGTAAVEQALDFMPGVLQLEASLMRVSVQALRLTIARDL
jgi:hypothetical protein